MTDKLEVNDGDKWIDRVPQASEGTLPVVVTPSDPMLEVVIDKKTKYGSGKEMKVKNPNPTL